MNPKKIQGMMKKMGINQEELGAHRVIIEMEDKNIVIDEPSVVKVNMQGNVSYQITGEEREESKEEFSDEDVDLVKGKTGKGEEEVRKVLEKNHGDIAESIMELS